MNQFSLREDIRVLCVVAESFPEGISEAFQAIEKIVPDMTGRTLFGISSPVNGVIVYKAAVTELFQGEGKKYNCESFVIPKGEYSIETLHNLSIDSNLFRKTFQNLLSTPILDKTFPCVEWYKSSKEVICMVKIKKQ
ncbi:MAG TPA: transcriptional regulator [Cyclobacteriaceae bacterium]|jgi:hypothetical protein|nr:transcriptional regulator [Cyclobacteriaceae bacterium]